MEKLAIIVAIITVIFLTSALYFNKEIKKLFNTYNVENFNVDTSDIGLKWVYYTNMEPDGDKINRWIKMLSYNQFTIKEIEDGIAYEILQEQI